MRRSRAIFAACVVIGSGAATLLACTAGDEVTYTTGASSDGDGGPGGEGGRIVHESGVSVPDSSRPTLTAPASVDCQGGFEGGTCDTTAGQGCCFSNASLNAGGDCHELWEFSDLPTVCHNAGDVFVMCAADDEDSPCCFMNDGGTGRGINARHIAECPGAHVCVLGTKCPSDDGGDCHALPANCGSSIGNTQIGYCGSAAPPCD